jgi:hypothetical protein
MNESVRLSEIARRASDAFGPRGGDAGRRPRRAVEKRDGLFPRTGRVW